MRLEYSVNPPPTISVRSIIWITVPIGALIVAILTANFLLLNYVHVFTSMLWTGTDIFYYALRKSEPVLAWIQILMRRYVKVFATQAILQFVIIFIRV